jgi:ribulose-bisphosphate carboxylase small chain
MPLFDLPIEQTDVVMREIRACREAHPDTYIKLIAYDSSKGRQTTALSFIVHRPSDEPGFRLDRTESHDRVLRYSLHPYVADAPSGHRYRSNGGTS